MLLNCGVGETLEIPLDSKEIQLVHPKGNQSWRVIGRTNDEAETPILWSLDSKNWFTGKDPDAGKYWRLEEKGVTEDEMVGWHHQLDGHEFEYAPGVGDGWGSLVCCSLWVANSRTRLRDWTDWTRRSPGVELAIHSSILAWNIPCREEPGWLQYMGLQRVRHNWATELNLGRHTYLSIMAT